MRERECGSSVFYNIVETRVIKRKKYLKILKRFFYYFIPLPFQSSGVSRKKKFIHTLQACYRQAGVGIPLEMYRSRLLFFVIHIFFYAHISHLANELFCLQVGTFFFLGRSLLSDGNNVTSFFESSGQMF